MPWLPEDRQRRWRTAAEHGRTAQDIRRFPEHANLSRELRAWRKECLEEVQDVQELPEALCGGQLGEESARRNKGLLKKAGTAIVLRKGAPWRHCSQEYLFGFGFRVEGLGSGFKV